MKWDLGVDVDSPGLRGELGGTVRVHRPEFRSRLRWLLGVLDPHPQGLGVRLCTSEEMAGANARFRAKPTPTDVLSFPPGAGLGAYLGDVLLCVPVCLAQARRRRQTPAEEAERLVVHGVVHLRGLDHERGEAHWRVMTALERTLRRELVRELGPPHWLEVP